MAVAVGLASTATGTITGIEESSLRALAKLEQVMPARVRQRCQTVERAVVTLPRAAAAIDARTLTTIAAACRDNERLRFDYRSHAGASSLRDTEPHRVVHDGRRWCLPAWDREGALAPQGREGAAALSGHDPLVSPSPGAHVVEP